MRLGWLAFALLGGCGGKVVVDGASGRAPDTSCGHACEIAAPACGVLTVAECTEMCEDNAVTDDIEGCVAEDDAVVQCIIDAEDPVVCGNGTGVPASCQQLYEVWQGCIQGP